MSSTDFIFNLPSMGEVLSEQIANENENERVMKQKRLNQERRERIELILDTAYKTQMREAKQNAIHELMKSRVMSCIQFNLSSKERLVIDVYYGTNFDIFHYDGKPNFGPYGSEWRNCEPNPLFVGLFKDL